MSASSSPAAPESPKDVSDVVKLKGPDALLQAIENAPVVDLGTYRNGTSETAVPSRPMVEFLPPSQLRSFVPPEGWKIVGDYHIQRAAPFVIGGPPGTGKSRSLTALAVAGATGQPWFGLEVPRRFRTMILQCENGRVRLKNETADLPEGLDEWVRISPPPPFGFAFSDPAFLRELRQAVEIFRPDVFGLDPWNRLARDDKGKDYKEAFEAILSALPPGDDCPAVGIVAHTRKPATGERANGRALLNLLAGSYVLGSVPRSAFVLQPASDDPTDDRIVWTCCKNNDGPEGSPSAWQRRNGLFAPCPDFDWEDFNAGPDQSSRATVTEEHMDTLFEGGKRRLATGEAVRQLMEQTGFKKTACYTALKPGGRFGTRLVEASGLLRWKGVTNA